MMNFIFILILLLYNQGGLIGGCFSSPKGWKFTKHASNPLIAKQYASSPDKFEYYPPCIYYDGSSNYYAMAKNNNEGWGYTSSDGISWTETGKLLSKGSGADWDAGLSSPNYMMVEGSTIHLFYSGYQSGPNFSNKIGYASVAISGSLASTWGTTFTKSGGNPVYDCSEYNTANSTSFECILLSDIVKVGSTYYFFAILYMNDNSNYDLAYGTGTSITDLHITTRICNIDDIPGGMEQFQYPVVFKNANGKWRMTLTIGYPTVGYRNEWIIAGYTNAATPTGWTINPAKILQGGESGSYDESQAYNAAMLKDINGTPYVISGKYRLYYAGHNTTTYTGVMCLATTDYIP